MIQCIGVCTRRYSHTHAHAHARRPSKNNPCTRTHARKHSHSPANVYFIRINVRARRLRLAHCGRLAAHTRMRAFVCDGPSMSCNFSIQCNKMCVFIANGINELVRAITHQGRTGSSSLLRVHHSGTHTYTKDETTNSQREEMM